jgi:hypothetical protein
VRPASCRWDSGIAAWDWSGWKFASVGPRPPPQVRVFKYERLLKPHVFNLLTSVNTAVYFSPLQVKNKLSKGATL